MPSLSGPPEKISISGTVRLLKSVRHPRVEKRTCSNSSSLPSITVGAGAGAVIGPGVAAGAGEVSVGEGRCRIGGEEGTEVGVAVASGVAVGVAVSVGVGVGDGSSVLQDTSSNALKAKIKANAENVRIDT